MPKQAEGALSLPPEKVDLSPWVELDAPKEISGGRLLRALGSGAFGKFGLQLLGIMVGTDCSVDGLGFEIRPPDGTDLAQEQEVLRCLESADQKSLSWEKRCQMAAVVSYLRRNPPEREAKNPVAAAQYLRQQAHVGDVVFFSQGGSGSDAYSELFGNIARHAFAEREGDLRFPFTHLGIVVGDNEILHITPRGLKLRSFERLVVENTRYDAIAFGRLNLSEEHRGLLAKEAQAFAEGRTFNKGWMIRDYELFPWGQPRVSGLKDSSADDGKMVCIDIVTEPSKVLREAEVPLSEELAFAMSPLEVFSAPDISIVEAVEIARDYDLW